MLTYSIGNPPSALAPVERGYHLIMYGLTASPPTRAHQAILETLLEQFPSEKCTIRYYLDASEKIACTLTREDDVEHHVNSETLAALGLHALPNAQNRTYFDRQVKKLLAQQGQLNYTEILCLPTADGPPVLGKTPSAPAEHRFEMLKIAARDVVEETQDPRIVVSDFEIEFGKVTGLPSSTANTLIILRDGLRGLLAKEPLENYLLTNPEKALNESEKQALLHKKQENIESFLAAFPEFINGWSTQNTYLAIGLDSFNTLPGWRNIGDILAHSNKRIVFIRAGESTDTLDADRSGNVITLSLNNSSALSACSSTKIRKCIEEGREVPEEWISPNVMAYIRENNLFTPPVSTISPRR